MRPALVVAGLCTIALAAGLGALVHRLRELAATPLTFPALIGHVVDAAQILSPAVRRQLEQSLAEHEETTGDQVVVATVNSLQGHSIEDYSKQLGRSWGIGRKGRENQVILLIASDDADAQIEVGPGLKERLTETQCGLIEGRIIPALEDGDFDAGVQAGTAAILRVLHNEPLVPTTLEKLEGLFTLRLFVMLFLPVWCLVFLGSLGTVLHDSWKRRKQRHGGVPSGT
jgi:uncharacterized protein